MSRLTVLRVALALGVLVDGFVGALGLFAPQQIQPMLDIPVRDPALALIAGGEFVVVAAVYGLTLSDTRRFRPLLWLCALDQAFAALLPALLVARGALPASAKIVGPIPVSVLLAVIFAMGAAGAMDRRPRNARSA